MSTLRQLIVLGLFVCMNSNVVQAQWVDHFDDICSLETWMDIQETEGWNIQALESHDISKTLPGHFMMMPYTVSWYANWRGPLMYRMAAGDFVLTTHITVTNRDADDIPGPFYSLGGIMVRNPKTMTNGIEDWLPGEEDYVFLSLGHAANNHPSCSGCPPPHFEVKSTVNSSSTLSVSSIDTNVVDIRMVRLAPYVLVLYRFPGQEWEVHHRYFRSDLMDSVQVGMVTYTDWDKVYTYEPAFHNSHELNDQLEPDPSSNPGLPFSPDIISSYDFIELQNAVFPAEWAGLDLVDEADVSDAEILVLFGDTLPIPFSSSEMIWLGRNNQDWNDTGNWLSGGLPVITDTVIINSCACPEANCVALPEEAVSLSGLILSEGAVLTIPAGGVLEISGYFLNEGTIIIHGDLLISTGSGHQALNYGELDCREGGSVVVEE